MKRILLSVFIIVSFIPSKGWCWQFSNFLLNYRNIELPKKDATRTAYATKDDLTRQNENKNFQIEFYGGFSRINPKDLNLRNKFTYQYRKFWNADFLSYAVNEGYINSFDSRQEGEFKFIKNALPFGFRFKYYLFESVSLSLGFKCILASQASNVKYTYTIKLNDGKGQATIYDYTPQTISANAYIPMLGIHFENKINSPFGIEAFLTGGPLFGQCGYEYQLIYFEGERVDQYNIQTGYRQDVEANGSGTGLAVDGGVRVNYKLRNHVAVFLEGGYAYQVVNKLSGKGVNIAEGELREWEGDWIIINYQHSHLWGVIDTQYPTNSFSEDSNLVRYFKLDLSGFQVRVGVDEF